MVTHLSCSKPSAPRTPEGGGRENGFTLVEILVAMTLLGLVLAVLAGGLRLGTRVWEDEAERSEGLSDSQGVQIFLRRLVQQAYPYHEGDATAVAFEGTPEKMAFVAPLPSHVGFGGFHRVRLELEKGRLGERQLIFRSILLHPDVDPADAHEQVRGETVLLGGIGGLRFKYFGADGHGAPPSWRSEWVRMDKLPDLVHIEISAENGGVGLWPALVVSPMLTAETVCVREPNVSRCRASLSGE